MALKQVRVVVAGGRRLFRETIIAVLERQAGIAVAAEIPETTAAAEAVVRLRPDCVALVVSALEAEGLDAALGVARLRDTAPVLVIDADPDPPREARALDGGALGYLSGDRSLDDLVQAVRRVASGKRFPTAPGPGGPVVEDGPGGIMTPREREIAVLLADGYSTKEAAAALGIGIRTAESHRAAILHKLGARNVADVVKYCIRNRLIDVD